MFIFNGVNTLMRTNAQYTWKHFISRQKTLTHLSVE